MKCSLGGVTDGEVRYHTFAFKTLFEKITLLITNKNMGHKSITINLDKQGYKS